MHIHAFRMEIALVSKLLHHFKSIVFIVLSLRVSHICIQINVGFMELFHVSYIDMSSRFTYMKRYPSLVMIFMKILKDFRIQLIPRVPIPLLNTLLGLCTSVCSFRYGPLFWTREPHI